MIIQPAGRSDLPRLVELRNQSKAWLAAHGSDQWQNPWPNHEAMVERLQASIDAGETWMVFDDQDQPVATLALDRYADPQLWTPEEREQPAFYLHRLIVDRAHAGRGYGTRLLDWACDHAAAEAALWVRIDVWTTNMPLQRYYLAHGFQHVRTLELTDCPSGALFQRLALPTPTHNIIQRARPPVSKEFS